MSGEKLKGVPYTGTLPATLTGTKAGYLHSYKIFGNTEQTGTPTPENPIYPSECGERTGNLLNFADLMTAPEGMIGTVAFPHVLEITLEPNTTYTMCANGYGSAAGVADTNRSLYFDGTDNYINSVYVNHPSTKTTDSTGKLNIGFMSQRTNAQQYINNTAQVWIIEGSTALPYEPYGYKLPLLSGSTPVDIYIGSEPLRKIGDYADYIDYGTGKIVRQVKKLLLDGTESFTILREGVYRTTINGYLRELDLHIAVCSHFGGGMTIYSTSSIINNTVSFLVSDSGNNYGYFTSSNYQTVSAFKTFIQQQYSNGTPVTLWYLLATPTEEDPPVPFPQIPTSANSTTISWAGQGLAPSEFDSIQEWVDIPTYTYTNGAWVADN